MNKKRLEEPTHIKVRQELQNLKPLQLYDIKTIRKFSVKQISQASHITFVVP